MRRHRTAGDGEKGTAGDGRKGTNWADERVTLEGEMERVGTDEKGHTGRRNGTLRDETGQMGRLVGKKWTGGAGERDEMGRTG